MKIGIRLVWKILLLLGLAAVGYSWATGLMDSIFDYRSPLKDHPPAPGASLNTALTRRVVFVLIDALRIDTSLDTQTMPFLAELRQRGAWLAMYSRPPSYSQTGYNTLLTGAWPAYNDGPPINLPYEEIPTFTQDDLFSALHRAGLKTAISGFNWFEKLVPQEAVSVSFYTAGEDATADRQVVDAALPWLDDPSYAFVLIHIDQVDYAGHYEGGPRDPRWNAAARRSDDLLGEIANQLDFSQDTLLVTSDHGQVDRGGHGGQDAITLIEPFILVGAGVRPGQYPDGQMVDVAPTLAALLGCNLPASSQGHVRQDLLSFTAEQNNQIHTALAAQQDGLLQAYQTATGKKLTVPSGNDPVATHQAALESVTSLAALLGERLPRAFSALAWVAVAVAVVYRLRGHGLAWMLAAALLYMLLFNLRYGILDGRTYSLSSVASANDVVLYIAVTVLASLAVSWLAFYLGMQAYRQTPSQAANLVLDWILVVIGLLALPVLWHLILNGAVVTWRLPDFASSFLGFLFLLQIMFVGLGGLLLAGVSALAARLRSS